jgi:hypothetical protein
MTTTLCTLCDSYVVKTGTYCEPCINWHGAPEVETAIMCDCNDNYENENENDNDDNEYKIMTSYDDENYEPYSICYGIEDAESVAKDAVSKGVFNYARIINSTCIVDRLFRLYEYKVLTSQTDYDYEIYTSCKTPEEAIKAAKDAVSNGVFDYARVDNSSGPINFMMRENWCDGRDEYEEYIARLAGEYA